MFAVGLMYRYGYFDQEISANGYQVEIYQPQKFSHLPVIPVRDEKGEWVIVTVPFPGREV
jgi:glucan phosphorylase